MLEVPCFLKHALLELEILEAKEEILIIVGLWGFPELILRQDFIFLYS